MCLSLRSSLVLLLWIPIVSAAPDPPEKRSAELKVIAQTSDLPWRQEGKVPHAMRRQILKAVIRNAEELVATTDLKDKAKDEATQKEVMELVAETLKVPKIDWKTQMLVVIDEGRAINCTLFVSKPKVEDKTVTVTYNVDTFQAGALRSMPRRAMVLVDRWEGEVKFIRTTSKGPAPPRLP